MNTVTVNTFDKLSSALKKAKRGDTVYIDDNAQIDCKETLELRGDITTASNGARLFSSAGRPIFRVTGSCNSISGLHLDPDNIGTV